MLIIRCKGLCTDYQKTIHRHLWVSDSTRGPAEFAAGEQMKMNMEHGLSDAFAVINNHPVSVPVETVLSGDSSGDMEQVADKFPIRSSDTMNVGDMFFGNNEEMKWRLGVEVFKCDRPVVLVNDCRGDLFLDDPAKNTVWIFAHSYSP